MDSVMMDGDSHRAVIESINTDSEFSLVVSVEEASTIAKRDLSYSKSRMRSSVNDTYSITTYKDGGRDIFYIINYDRGGFKLISATKVLNPVLAFSDTGKFNGFDIPDGVDIWISQISDEIKYRESLSKDSLFKTVDVWNTVLTSPAVIKRATPIDPDDESEGLQRIDDAMMQAIDEGAVRFYKAGEQFCEDSQLCEETWANAKLCVCEELKPRWESFCFVAKFETERIVDVPNFIETQWGQNNRFNMYYPDDEPAGCVPVAFGQLMYYYKYPTSYNWDGMDTYWGNQYSARLLRDIAIAAKTQNGGTFRENGLNALKSFGYLLSYFDANIIYSVIPYINRKKPVVMYGKEQGSVDGHAWLATGYKESTKGNEYKLYYVESPMADIYPEYVQYFQTISDRFIYMNWGWNGSDNGYYRSTVTNSNRVFSLTNILVAEPNK